MLMLSHYFSSVISPLLPGLLDLSNGHIPIPDIQTIVFIYSAVMYNGTYRHINKALTLDQINSSSKGNYTEV